jgi:hypothetical protein
LGKSKFFLYIQQNKNFLRFKISKAKSGLVFVGKRPVCKTTKKILLKKITKVKKKETKWFTFMGSCRVEPFQF